MNELSGHTEIEWGGKKRPLKFNALTLRKFSERYGLTLEQAMGLNFTQMELHKAWDYIYFAMLVGYKSEGKEVDFTEDDVTMWAGEATVDDWEKIFRAMYWSNDIGLKRKAKDSKKK